MAGMKFTNLGLESIRKLLLGENPENLKFKYIAVGEDNSPTMPDMVSLNNEIYRDEAEIEIIDEGTFVLKIRIPEISQIDGKYIGEIGVFNELGLICRETYDPKYDKKPGESKVLSITIAVGGVF